MKQTNSNGSDLPGCGNPFWKLKILLRSYSKFIELLQYLSLKLYEDFDEIFTNSVCNCNCVVATKVWLKGCENLSKVVEGFTKLTPDLERYPSRVFRRFVPKAHQSISSSK